MFMQAACERSCSLFCGWKLTLLVSVCRYIRIGRFNLLVKRRQLTGKPSNSALPSTAASDNARCVGWLVWRVCSFPLLLLLLLPSLFTVYCLPAQRHAYNDHCCCLEKHSRRVDLTIHVNRPRIKLLYTITPSIRQYHVVINVVGMSEKTFIKWVDSFRLRSRRDSLNRAINFNVLVFC